MPIYKTQGKKDGLQKYRVRINYTDRAGKAHQLDRVAYGSKAAKDLERRLSAEYSNAVVSANNSMTVQKLYDECICAKRSDKLKITNNLVKQQYKRSFFHKYFSVYLGALFIISLFSCILLAFIRHNVLINPVAIYILLLFLPYTIIDIWEITYSIIELTRVLRGNFFLTADKIVERREEQTIRKMGTLPSCFRFEKYNYFGIHKTYSFIKRRSIPAYRQFNEAYLDDTYYVAVLSKNKKIIAVFNQKNYDLE